MVSIDLGRISSPPSLPCLTGGTTMHEPDFSHGAGVRSGALLHHLDAARHRATRPSVTAVIPTLNEADNLRWLLPRLSGVDEVIVVDGESTDGTADVARRLRP